MDTLSPKERSKRMSLIRAKDTKPEMLVRRLVHRLGFRYRLHRTDLPGKPDLVFRPRKKVIFVHGCFWHQHEGCKIGHLPKSKIEFWRSKLEGNRARDAKNQKALTLKGWKCCVIWECETKNLEALEKRIKEFLTNSSEKGRGQTKPTTRNQKK